MVVATHSYGDNVVRSFMAWAEAAAGPGWAEEHLEAVVNIAGTTLGVPKSVSALLSGACVCARACVCVCARVCVCV